MGDISSMVPNSSLKIDHVSLPVSFCATHWLIPDLFQGQAQKPREVVIEEKRNLQPTIKSGLLPFQTISTGIRLKPHQNKLQRWQL